MQTNGNREVLVPAGKGDAREGRRGIVSAALAVAACAFDRGAGGARRRARAAEGVPRDDEVAARRRSGRRSPPRGRRQPKESTGTFSFQRPGKFRWAYEKPFEQLIVGDGERLWIYDRDLNQVIVRKLDRALGSTPAALLAGGGALEANFELTDGGQPGRPRYVEAKPRTPDTGFERVRIGFANNLPRAMELRDTLGNVTTLRFEAFERNTALDAGQFRYVPPPGADVVGEAK